MDSSSHKYFPKEKKGEVIRGVFRKGPSKKPSKETYMVFHLSHGQNIVDVEMFDCILWKADRILLLHLC